MTAPIASTGTQTIATIAFGIVATLIGAFTIWQGWKTWRRLYARWDNRPVESDIESQTSEAAVELEARPSRHVFELPTSLDLEAPLFMVAAPSAVSEDARLLNPVAAFTTSTAPTTTTTATVAGLA